LGTALSRLADAAAGLEIVTFEEMNQRKPVYLLTHALGRVMRESKEPVGQFTDVVFDVAAGEAINGPLL
jgi:hypothetical protein